MTIACFISLATIEAMKGLKLQTLAVSILLALFSLSLQPKEAFAAIQSLNGQTGQTQTFQNDSNVTISSSNNVHSLGWFGLLPISRGGTNNDSFTEGSVLFMGQNKFRQDNNNLFWDRFNNRLGIGTSFPSAQLHLGGNGQAITENYGLLIDDKTAGTNNYNIWSGPPRGAFDPWEQARIGDALNVFASLNSPAGAGSFVSQGDGAFAVGAETLTTGEGGAYSGWFTANSLGQPGQYVREMASGYFRSSNIGAANVGNMDGILIDYSDPTSAGGITESSTGIEIRGPANGISNYGITTGMNAGDNNYAIYNAGSAKSYFGGNVGIGTNVPSAALDVVGTIKGDSTIVLGTSSIPACIEMADSDGDGVSYVTINDGVLSGSTTKPSFCQ